MKHIKLFESFDTLSDNPNISKYIKLRKDLSEAISLVKSIKYEITHLDKKIANETNIHDRLMFLLERLSSYYLSENIGYELGSNLINYLPNDMATRLSNMEVEYNDTGHDIYTTITGIWYTIITGISYDENSLEWIILGEEDIEFPLSYLTANDTIVVYNSLMNDKYIRSIFNADALRQLNE